MRKNLFSRSKREFFGNKKEVVKSFIKVTFHLIRQSRKSNEEIVYRSPETRKFIFLFSPSKRFSIGNELNNKLQFLAMVLRKHNNRLNLCYRMRKTTKT